MRHIYIDVGGRRAGKTAAMMDAITLGKTYPLRSDPGIKVRVISRSAESSLSKSIYNVEVVEQAGRPKYRTGEKIQVEYNQMVGDASFTFRGTGKGTTVQLDLSNSADVSRLQDLLRQMSKRGLEEVIREIDALPPARKSLPSIVELRRAAMSWMSVADSLPENSERGKLEKEYQEIERRQAELETRMEKLTERTPRSRMQTEIDRLIERKAVIRRQLKSTGDATNHLGEREYQTYAAWRAAAKAAGATSFEGDKDIAHAKGPNGHVGEWYGDKGVIYKTRDAKDSGSGVKASKTGPDGKQNWFSSNVEYLGPTSKHWLMHSYKIGVETEEDFQKHVRWSLGLQGATRIKFGTITKTRDAAPERRKVRIELNRNTYFVNYIEREKYGRHSVAQFYAAEKTLSQVEVWVKTQSHLELVNDRAGVKK